MLMLAGARFKITWLSFHRTDSPPLVTFLPGGPLEKAQRLPPPRKPELAIFLRTEPAPQVTSWGTPKSLRFGVLFGLLVGVFGFGLRVFLVFLFCLYFFLCGKSGNFCHYGDFYQIIILDHLISATSKLEGSKKNSWQERVKAKLKAKGRISTCVLECSVCLEVLAHYSCLAEGPSKHPVCSATQKKSFRCCSQSE